MNVKTQQELKKNLKEVGAKLIVVKNTLFALAAKEAKFTKKTTTDTVLKGQTALIVTEDDPVAPLQILAKFASEFDVPQLKVGVVEGSFQDKDALETLSKLPGKDVLLAQVVGSIGSPVYGLFGTLNAKMQELIYTLEQASKKK